jgi:proteasome accessory factor B
VEAGIVEAGIVEAGIVECVGVHAMSRIERLLNLTAALLHTERALSADELYERVPGYPDDKLSFRRQFERDKDALRQLGLPLSIETLSGAYADQQTGYRIPPDQYYLPDPGLSSDELAAIHLAARVVRVDGMATQDVAWKLGRSDPSADELAATETAVVPANERLAVVFQSISEKRTVVFSYKGETRTVDPDQLSFRNGHWYLLGFDRTREDSRSFRIDRIDGSIEVGQTSQRKADTTERSVGYKSHPWELGEGVSTEVLLRIGAAQALWARAHLGDQSIVERHEDGSIVFRLQVRNVDAFRSFALGFLDRAEVVSPRNIRALMIEWLDSLVNRSLSSGGVDR